MSATGLYVKACRYLYSNESNSLSSWNELSTLLPQLRAALSCRVCRSLIVDPQSSRYCQHYVCRGCLKNKRALDPGCKWCLDLNKLQQSDRQVRVVLACYKLLCETIQLSDFYSNVVPGDKIDNLLSEAVSNPDVLPDSSSVSASNESNTTRVETSRDTGEMCARENVTKNVNKHDREVGAGKRRKSIHSEEASTKVNLDQYSEQCCAILDSSKPTRKAVKRKYDETQQHITQTHEWSELKACMFQGDINNNETEQDHVTNAATLKRMRSRSRNGKARQSCEEGSYMKKRKLRQIIGAGCENDNISLHRPVDQYWKCRPRKLRKLDLGTYNKKTIPI